MSSFEWNKIAGAILGSMMLAMISGIIASVLVRPQHPEHPVYAVAAPEPAQSKAAAAPAQPENIGPLLAKADINAGKEQTKKCAACHTFEKGGPNRIGPNLYDIVGEPIAQGKNGYQFSAALEAHKGEKWTPEELNKWLTNPQAFAKGTKMTFAGLPKIKDRADVIAYLNSLSDNPKPLTAKD